MLGLALFIALCRGTGHCKAAHGKRTLRSSRRKTPGSVMLSEFLEPCRCWRRRLRHSREGGVALLCFLPAKIRSLEGVLELLHGTCGWGTAAGRVC